MHHGGATLGATPVRWVGPHFPNKAVLLSTTRDARDREKILLIMTVTPITIITGFLGSGKTTLILNLIPQLPKSYKICLVKNEYGDVAVDSQLAKSASISGVKELLNGCICCNLVGQLGDALETLKREIAPDRIVIETSGSAFPATLALEINRLARATGDFSLDGVIAVIDVENWKGYDDTSYTAKMQARYTDLIIFNKCELVDERRYEDCLDRVGDLETEIAKVQSDKGRVDKGLLLGLDSALAKDESGISMHGGPSDYHIHGHQSEVEVLSVTLMCKNQNGQAVNIEKLEAFLSAAPKDEIYRIKALLLTHQRPKSLDQVTASHEPSPPDGTLAYILNWAFGRWTFTAMSDTTLVTADDSNCLMRMTLVSVLEVGGICREIWCISSSILTLELP